MIYFWEAKDASDLRFAKSRDVLANVVPGAARCDLEPTAAEKSSPRTRRYGDQPDVPRAADAPV